MMETTTVLDELTTRVLAPNPSPMTLDGTNTYVLGSAGQPALVVDPGPNDAGHRASIEAAVGDRDVAVVVVTHHHADHAAAAWWAGPWGARLLAFDPGRVPGAQVLRDGARVRAGDVDVEAVHTPGHASDHVCLRLRPTDVVLTGDHVLGRGTSVVAWPDGDLTAYLSSLTRLAQLPATRLFPGHGPVLDDPGTTIRQYTEHREMRDRQILAAIEAGDDTPVAIVRRVYHDVPEVLHPAAERSVRAHLARLVQAGAVPPSILGEELRPIDPSTLPGGGA